MVLPITPPVNNSDTDWIGWYLISNDNPAIKYLSVNLWPYSNQPASWEVAKLSHATYIYRESSTKWTVVAKHYSEKTGKTAEKYSLREFNCTKQAQSMGFDSGELRIIKPLGVHRGVLFLEYVDGLTLENLIAIRKNRPGSLISSLKYTGKFMALLHRNGIQTEGKANFESSLLNIYEIIDNLGKYGVLKNEPLFYDGIVSLLDKWKDKKFMEDYIPTCIHGDATTSNFIFPSEGGIVAIDWERFYTGDPASDLGRITAEIYHSIKQHGGTVSEVLLLMEIFIKTYSQELPSVWDIKGILKRLPFYQALSTFRIARNGWISQLDRIALVTQGSLLLANDDRLQI